LPPATLIFLTSVRLERVAGPRSCYPLFFVEVFRITLSVSEGTGSGKTVPSLTLRVIRRRNTFAATSLLSAEQSHPMKNVPDFALPRPSCNCARRPWHIKVSQSGSEKGQA